MESVLRGVAVYFFVYLVLRASGKRSLSQITTFDFVLLLIISETTQQALLGDDFSLTNAFIIIVTLVGIDIALSLLKQRSPRAEQVLEGQPLLLVADGKLLQERLDNERIDEQDILSAARLQGLERMDQVKYAVLERSGGISIIPK